MQNEFAITELDKSERAIRPSRRISKESSSEGLITARDIVYIGNEAQEVALFNYLNDSKNLTEFNKRIKKILAQCDDLQDWSHMLYEDTGWIHESAGTVPSGNRETYLAEGLHHFDLMLAHAKRSDTPILQSTINEHVRNSPIENEIYERNKLIARLMDEYGYPEYFNIPFSSACKGARGIFSVATRKGNPEKVRNAILKHRSLILKLARAVDYIGCMRFNTHFPNTQDPVINNGPLRLLQVIVNTGCEIQEAAEMLNISRKTAYNHSRAACAALGVSNFHAALVAALKRKLVTIQPDWKPPPNVKFFAKQKPIINS